MKTIVSDDVTIAYERCGQVGAPALLLLHGGFVSHRAWEPQTERLIDGYDVILPDLRGHGLSSLSPTLRYGLEEMALDMWRLLDALEIDRVVCVGHSLGGMIAQIMARQAPRRIHAIVLADTTYSTSSTLIESAQTLLARAAFRVLTVGRVGKISADQLSTRRPDLGPYLRAEMARFKWRRKHFHAIWRAVFAFDSRGWLDRVTCPVLVLIAADNNATRRQVSGFCDALQDARWSLVPRSGHMLGWDNPDDFNHRVIEFLEEIQWS